MVRLLWLPISPLYGLSTAAITRGGDVGFDDFSFSVPARDTMREKGRKQKAISKSQSDQSQCSISNSSISASASASSSTSPPVPCVMCHGKMVGDALTGSPSLFIDMRHNAALLLAAIGGAQLGLG